MGTDGSEVRTSGHMNAVIGSGGAKWAPFVMHPWKAMRAKATARAVAMLAGIWRGESDAFTCANWTGGNVGR